MRIIHWSGTNQTGGFYPCLSKHKSYRWSLFLAVFVRLFIIIRSSKEARKQTTNMRRMLLTCSAWSDGGQTCHVVNRGQAIDEPPSYSVCILSSPSCCLARSEKDDMGLNLRRRLGTSLMSGVRRVGPRAKRLPLISNIFPPRKWRNLTYNYQIHRMYESHLFTKSIIFTCVVFVRI